MSRRTLIGYLVIGVIAIISLITLWDGHRRVVYHGRSLVEWEAALYDTSAGVRDTAAYALTRLAPTSPHAVPGVIRAEASALADENPDVRADATSALIALSRTSDAIVPAMIKVVEQNANDHARGQALQVIAAMGPAATAATPAVVHALADSSAAVRLIAVGALGRVGLAPGELGVVVLATTDTNADVRAAAIETLIALDAPPDTLRLVADRSAHDADPMVRAQVAYALAASGDSPDVIVRLTRGLTDPDPRVRSAAATVLGRLGSKAASAGPALERAASDSDREVRRIVEAAIRAVARP